MLKCQNPDCGREFLYAAKRIEFDDATLTDDDATLETYICPFCLGLDLCEVEETQAKIESIVSVKIAEADALIKQGYEVKDTYASTVTLVKKFSEESKNRAKNSTEIYNEGYVTGYNQAKVACGDMSQDEADEILKKVKEEKVNVHL